MTRREYTMYIVNKTNKLGIRELRDFVSPATAFRYFKSLENKGIIKREGKGKNIYYMLK